MLSGALPITIPGVSSILNKIDGIKAKFLAVPANTRAALDKLARVRMTITKTHSITVDENDAIIKVENNLKRIQLEWDTAAQRFTQLDESRRNQPSLTIDTITIAGQLLTSASYVVRNADASVAAVDSIAKKYLSPEQLSQLSIQTTGFSGSGGAMSVGAMAGIAAVAFLLLRRRS